MSVLTKAIVKDDIKSVIKTFEGIGKREGFTVNFDYERYVKEGFSRIIMTEIGRMATIYDFNKLNKSKQFSEVAKEILPKNGRTLKNAKNGIVISLGSNGVSQKLLFTFLKEFPTHGYLQLKDTGRGGFIYVGDKGFVKTNTNRSKQELQLVYYFNGMANNVKTNKEELKESKGNVSKIYFKYSYDNNGKVFTYNAGRKLIDELVIFMDNGEVYLIDGTEFRDLRDSNSYYTETWVRGLIKPNISKDIGKRNFEDIFTY